MGLNCHAADAAECPELIE